jgi:DNA excision repair protein ERCC-3
MLMDNSHSFQPHNPLIVQSDHTLLLEVHNPLYEPARIAIGAFAELAKSPEHMHTYRITSLSLWNAAAAGLTAERMVATLVEFAKYPVSPRPRPPERRRASAARSISKGGSGSSLP